MLKRYSLKALEKAINQTLALDPTSFKRMGELENKIIQVIIKPLNVSFFIVFQAQTLKLFSDYKEPAHTMIESSPLGLIRLSFFTCIKSTFIV